MKFSKTYFFVPLILHCSMLFSMQSDRLGTLQPYRLDALSSANIIAESEEELTNARRRYLVLLTTENKDEGKITQEDKKSNLLQDFSEYFSKKTESDYK